MRVFSLFRGTRAIVAGTLIGLLPLLFVLASPLLAPYAMLFIYCVAPCALCVTAILSGIAPMLVGVVASALSMYLCFGAAGASITCLFLLPAVIAFFAVFLVKLPFVRASLVVVAALALSQLACFLIIQGMTDGQMYRAAGEAASAYIGGTEECDLLLTTLYRMGMIGAPKEMAGDMFVEAIGGYALTQAARQDFLLSLSHIITTLLSSLVPNAIISQSLFGGVAAVALSVRMGSISWQREAFKSDIKNAPEFPTLDMPPLAKWYLPRGWGLRIGLLAVGRLLMPTGGAVGLAGVMMYAAFTSVYAIQGVALINFIQHKRDTKFVWRIVVPLLLFVFLNTALVILGVFDQINPMRGLRPPLVKQNQGKDDDLS